MNENFEKDNLRTQLVNELLMEPGKKLYNLSNDYLLKKVFSDISNLKLLLKDMFDEEIKSIKILSPLLLKNNKNMYAGCASLIIETNKGIKLLELQNIDKHNFFKRLIFYASAIIHIYGLKKNQDYKMLKRFECLAIVNFDISKNSLRNIKLKTEKNKEIDNNIKANIFNLKRDKSLKKTNKDLANVCQIIDDQHLKLIKSIIVYNRKDEEKLKEVEELFLKEKEDYKAAYMDGEERGISIGRKSGISIGRKTGISIGEKRGQNLEKENIARNMLRENYEIPIISKLTNLSEQKILSLR